MRLIDVLRQNYTELAANGLRASAWKLDGAAIQQLRREAADEGVDVVSVSQPATFLGVPIEEVPPTDAVQSDVVKAHCRYAPCQRLDRGPSARWDVFDLDAAEAMGAHFASRKEAEAHSVRLDLEMRDR